MRPWLAVAILLSASPALESVPRNSSAAAGGADTRAASPRPESVVRLPATRQSGAAVPAGDADALYRSREQLSNALAAAEQWERRLADDANDFESAWKLARACYWLGSHVPESDRRKRFEQGIEAARRAATLHPDRAEGHFWMAANMGAMAEGFGLRAGLRYRGPIKETLEKSLAIDPAYLDGGADRALGRWYARVPRLFGGSDTKAVEHLQRSLTYAPNSIASRFFLAETFLDMNRRDDARRELRAVLAAPFHPDWTPEEREFKAKAEAHLAKLR
jgi:tetratricopeptide (TPR) repeat protein